MKKFRLDENNEPVMDPQGKPSLEIADEMFRNVFSKKKNELRLKFPDLSEKELIQKTADYIRNFFSDQDRIC